MQKQGKKNIIKFISFNNFKKKFYIAGKSNSSLSNNFYNKSSKIKLLKIAFKLCLR